MAADVVVQHFNHEAVHGATSGGDELQDVGAGTLSIERALDGLDLPADPANPLHQLVFAAKRVGHVCRECPTRVYYGIQMWGMRSVAKIAALLCLLLTLWSAVAVVAHHHANSAESVTCPVCVAARAVAAIVPASALKPVFIQLSTVRVQSSPAQYRLPVFAFSGRAPPADQGPTTQSVLSS